MRFDDIFRPKVCSATVISYHSDALDYIEPLLTSSQGCGSCSHNTVKWCHDQGRLLGHLSLTVLVEMMKLKKRLWITDFTVNPVSHHYKNINSVLEADGSITGVSSLLLIVVLFIPVVSNP